MAKNENTELFYDDEKIEDFLYNENPPSPTPANIFLPLKEKMYEIRKLFEDESITAFSRKIVELLESDLPISRDIYIEISGFLKRLIPDLIKPILEPDIHDFGPIIEKLLTYAQNNDLYYGFGTIVYRWYEHHCHYPKAREVLQKLIEIAIKNKNRSKEALYKNNFAFDYLLEQEWEKAAPLFKEAADIFYNENDIFDYYNSMVNYWMCKYEAEINKITGIENIEREIASIEAKLGKSIEEKLAEGNYWHRRKPYILFAKLEEGKGNIGKAISFIEKSISAIQDNKTTYIEEDRDYLKKLEGKIE